MFRATFVILVNFVLNCQCQGNRHAILIHKLISVISFNCAIYLCKTSGKETYSKNQLKQTHIDVVSRHDRLFSTINHGIGQGHGSRIV